MLLSRLSNVSAYADAIYQLGRQLVGDPSVKQAGTPEPAYSLTGRLYLGKSGWIFLSVPNLLVRGVFDAMGEPGVALPLHESDGSLEAHISVLRPEEIEKIGGPDRLKHDRGKTYKYTLGRLESVVPENWKGVSRVWMLRVHSPELQELRRSYGLSSLPNEGKFAFHITVAIRRAGVLARSEVSKLTAAEVQACEELGLPAPELPAETPESPGEPECPDGICRPELQPQ